jgi:16S rRNA processing protein RimM
VLVELSDLPPLKPGEFYYFQVVGIEVHLSDGRRLGKIEDVFSTGANDVWVVRVNGREVLIPVIADVVKEIDIAGRRAIVEPIPGLLE